MKINPDFPIKELVNYGFQIFNDEYRNVHFSEEDPPFYYEDGFIYSFGHARRGQYYYMVIDMPGSVFLTSSKPDGSGGRVSVESNIIIKLVQMGILVDSEPK